MPCDRHSLQQRGTCASCDTCMTGAGMAVPAARGSRMADVSEKRTKRPCGRRARPETATCVRRGESSLSSRTTTATTLRSFFCRPPAALAATAIISTAAGYSKCVRACLCSGLGLRRVSCVLRGPAPRGAADDNGCLRSRCIVASTSRSSSASCRLAVLFCLDSGRVFSLLWAAASRRHDTCVPCGVLPRAVPSVALALESSFLSLSLTWQRCMHECRSLHRCQVLSAFLPRARWKLSSVQNEDFQAAVRDPVAVLHNSRRLAPRTLAVNLAGRGGFPDSLLLERALEMLAVPRSNSTRSRGSALPLCGSLRPAPAGVPPSSVVVHPLSRSTAVNRASWGSDCTAETVCDVPHARIPTSAQHAGRPVPARAYACRTGGAFKRYPVPPASFFLLRVRPATS